MGGLGLQEEVARYERGPVDTSHDENTANKLAILGRVGDDSFDRFRENTRFFGRRGSKTLPFRWEWIGFGRLYPPICVFDPRPDW